MSADQSRPGVDAAKETQKAALIIGFDDFLTSTPPAQQISRVDGVHYERASSQGSSHLLQTPPLKLHCPECEGIRVYRSVDDKIYVGHDLHRNFFLNYRCSNCRTAEKLYALYINFEGASDSAARCYKFGEYPPYGDPTPNRLLRLFGKDSGLFLKGRQCENHALGIGAFVYYRRVVENHKDQIFDGFINVAEKVAPELVGSFTEAKKQQHFLGAIEAVKDAMPQALLINGHNPLMLLHRALSKGLHAKTDDECLELAHHVRTVLAELAERIGVVLKDDANIKAAIAKLTGA
jgi:hypothetical protein